MDIIYASDQHEREVLNRAQQTTLLGVSFPVVSAEDLMLLKLKAGRPTDFDDVISVVRNPRRQLDVDYLWSWADRLGLQGELHYVLQATGGPAGG
ncbi:nucleotidyltransferase [Nitrospira sp. Nam80]